jgi:hypothetical protein
MTAQAIAILIVGTIPLAGAAIFMYLADRASRREAKR